MNTAQDRAREVRRQHHLKHPSEIEHVLHAQHIEVVRFPLVGRLEEIVVFDHIAIRDSIEDPRHVYELLAHALGHYLLHTGNQLLLVLPRGTVLAEKWERQAWDFAFELLMPGEIVEEHLREGWSDADLRDHFEVSDEFYEARMQSFRKEFATRLGMADSVDAEEC